jgi:hypothetical protein
MLRAMPVRMPPPPPRSAGAPGAAPPLARRVAARWDVVVAAVIFSGLIVVLGLAAAVMVQPSLAGDLHSYWPAIAALGLISTVAGSWWLWWRPR